VSGTRWLQGSAVAVAAVAVAALPASAGAFTPAETSLVSVSSQLVQGDGFSAGGTVSAGGRYVAFISSAGNLVAGDTNNAVDVFVRDRLAGTTRRTSLAPNGSEVVGDYFDLHLSYAGTRLGFVSTAGLAPGANGRFHAFVQDVGGATRLVSRSTSGAVENGATVGAALSGDGRFVAFTSTSTNLVAGDTNGVEDIFVRDLQSATTIRVSVGRNGAQGNGLSVDPAISRDGRYVAFASAASNLVAGDTNGFVDLFVRDLATGRTTLLSRARDGGPTNNGSGEPSVSDDGGKVAFSSDATNLVAGDTNGTTDVFVADVRSGAVRRVSVAAGGGAGNGESSAPSISGNGTRVLFHSVATNLVRGGTNATRNVFVRDLTAAATRLVSVGPGGRLGDGPSFAGDLSADGRHAVYDSRATNLVDGDTNGQDDVFARDETGDGCLAACLR
jgi:Tol biopolymer transport system component